jgi:hypothetical protein
MDAVAQVSSLHLPVCHCRQLSGVFLFSSEDEQNGHLKSGVLQRTIHAPFRGEGGLGEPIFPFEFVTTDI